MTEIKIARHTKQQIQQASTMVSGIQVLETKPLLSSVAENGLHPVESLDMLIDMDI